MATQTRSRRRVAGIQDNLEVFEIKNLSGGVRYDLPPTEIPENAVQDSLNVVFDNNTIRKRSGYGPPLFTIPGNPPVRLIQEWFDQNQGQWILVVTDTKFYVYQPSTNGWVDQTPTGGLHGTLSNPVTGVGFYGKFYMTNNVDKPFYWDTSGSIARFITATGAPLRAISVAAFFNHLMWFNVNDPALGTQPYQVTWSDNANGLIYNSGDAAIAQLEDTNDEITATEVIFSYLVIGRDASIFLAEWVGFPFFYGFFRRGEKHGILATNSFKKNEQFILGLGKSNIIAFDGSQMQPYFGEPVRNDLLINITDTSAYTDFRGSVKAITDIASRKYRLFVSSRADGQPDTEYDYSLVFKNWSKHRYNIIITSIGSAEAQTFITWNQATPAPQYEWMNRNVRWSDPEIAPISDNIWYGDSNGNIYQQTSNFLDDNGVAINSFFVTKTSELNYPDWVKELQRVQFIMMGSFVATLTVHVYSSDDGFNFTEAPSSPYFVNINKNPIAYADVFATGQFFKIRVENNNLGETFEIWKIRFAHVPLFRRTVA